MSARWLPVPGYEGHYEVSNHGQVRSLDRVIETRQGPRNKRGVMRKPKRGTHGYLELPLKMHGVSTMWTVHSLVMLAHVGPRPDGLEILHADDVKGNNRLSNLRYGTKSENAFEAVRNGRNPQRSKSSCVNGHKFSVENTGWTKGGIRWCKTCRHKHVNAWYHRQKKMAVHAH